MSDSCLSCGKFLKCTYANKRADYKCEKWSPMGAHKISIVDANGVPFNDGGEVDSTTGYAPSPFALKDSKELARKELDLEKVLDEVLDDETPVPKDLKVDDRDIPTMPNFWAFCFDRTWGFTGIKPFSRQMWIALKLFGEYCPVCTQGKVMKDIRNIPVGFQAKNFPEVVQLMNHGVCPKCKGTKREFIKKKLLKPYSELAFCAGQRSGKSLFTSFLVAYINHRYLKLQRPAEMFTGLSNVTLTATFVSLNFAGAVELLWTPIVDAIADSIWYCIAEGTQITLDDGTTKAIEDLKPGMLVATFEGSNTVKHLFDNGFRECKEVVLESGQVLVATDDHQVRCLSSDRTTLVWKKVSELTEDDLVVTA